MKEIVHNDVKGAIDFVYERHKQPILIVAHSAGGAFSLSCLSFYSLEMREKVRGGIIASCPYPSKMDPFKGLTTRLSVLSSQIFGKFPDKLL